MAATQQLHPDVVLLDVKLPDMSGFAVAHQLADLVDPPRVILVSSREATDYGEIIGRSPALGFISKPELTAARLRAMLGSSG